VKTPSILLSFAIAATCALSASAIAQSRGGIDYVDSGTMNTRLNGTTAKRATAVAPAVMPVERDRPQAVDLPAIAAPSVSTSVIDSVAGFAIRPSDGVLRRSLERWAAMAGFQLAWDVDRDHSVSADANFGDDFKSALGKALASTAHSDVPLRACMHDQGGKTLVRIIRATALCQ
jgi:hypothetical protein